jgi:hypothetical protein
MSRRKLHPEDNAAPQYGATPDELDKFAQAFNKELDADRNARRLKLFTGTLPRTWPPHQVDFAAK